MSERKRMFLLILIMITVSLVVVGITMGILYRTAFEENRERLVVTAQSHARLIEAVARFDAIYSDNYPEGPLAATLSQLLDAHQHYKGFGQTGEFTLARREGDSIAFLLSHRHYDLDNPKPVRFDSDLAEPMRLALSRKSGTVVGLDYRGEMVLAAYESVAELDLGIVTKIDLAEIRAPFVKAALIALGMGILVVLGGTALFLRVSNPMIRRMEKHTVELTRINAQLNREMEERKLAEAALQQAHDKLEIRVAERTSELVKVNETLERTKEQLSVIIEHLPLTPFSSKAGGDFAATFVGPRVTQVTGFKPEEFLSEPSFWAGRIHPDDRQRIFEDTPLLFEKGRHEYEYRWRIADGTYRWFSNSLRLVRPAEGSEDYIVGVFNDITEAKLMERQLLQNEKMASLGFLISGVAHEINNPNNFITFNIPILRDYLKELIPIIDDYAEDHHDFDLFGMKYPEFRKDIFKLLDNIEHGSHRINTTVSVLREFARGKDKVEPDWVDIKQVIEKGVAISQGKMKRMVKSFEVNIPEALPRIYTDPGALRGLRDVHL